MPDSPKRVYTLDAIKQHDFGEQTVTCAVRELLFSLHIWRQRTQRDIQPKSPLHLTNDGDKLQTGDVECKKPGNKHTSVTKSIINCKLDILVTVETGDPSATDVALRRSTRSRYHAIDQPQSGSQSLTSLKMLATFKGW